MGTFILLLLNFLHEGIHPPEAKEFKEVINCESNGRVCDGFLRDKSPHDVGKHDYYVAERVVQPNGQLSFVSLQKKMDKIARKLNCSY